MRQGTSIGRRGTTGSMLGPLAGAGRAAPKPEVPTVAACPAVAPIADAAVPRPGSAIATVPLVVLLMLSSRQLIPGPTAGAVK